MAAKSVETKPNIINARLDEITLDVELQPRETIDLALVAEYAEALQSGAVFPPVVAFKNGKAELLLADGWHRHYAHDRAGRTEIAVEVREGDRMEALRHSLQANAAHGKRRDEGTLKRAYQLAVKHELVDQTDIEGVQAVLAASVATAKRLTQSARDADIAYTKSLVVLLSSKGKSQREISALLERADYGRVDHTTVGAWLGEYAQMSQSPQPPKPGAARPEMVKEIEDELARVVAGELAPQIEDKVKGRYENRLTKLREQHEADQAKLAAERETQTQLRANAREEAKKRKAALDAEREARKEALAAERELHQNKVKLLTDQIADLKAKLDEKAKPTPEDKAASEERDRLQADLEQKSRALVEAQKRAETATEEANKEAEQKIKEAGERMIGPAAMAWFQAVKALETVRQLPSLTRHRHPFFEQKFLDEVDAILARLQEIKELAQRSRPDDEARQRQA